MLNRRIFASVAAMLLSVPTTPFAQNNPAPPIPIWSGEGSVPAGNGNRKVFLSPDEHSVIILWPNPDGTESQRRFDLHNEIYPNLRVHMENSSGGILYVYDLENGKPSKDTLNGFSVVIYPDTEAQTGAKSWKHGIMTSIVKERIGVPGAPSGQLALWMSPIAQDLLPGAATNFTLVTQARPGFTSAEIEHFPHLELTDEWPEKICDELEPVLALKWIAQHMITLGPRYGLDEPATRIASDYKIGIQELIRIHRLEPGSPFVKEVIASLEAVSADSSARIAVSQKPHSEMEAEILNALQLSLHFIYSGSQ